MKPLLKFINSYSMPGMWIFHMYNLYNNSKKYILLSPFTDSKTEGEDS